ncbi:MAG: NAD(P)-dependent glycerol-3-phosphate dehydrogenase, partial [Sedimentisphaerales bacterium]|nr:NAD(P)-dependent glycerol-3-phosphate dehydrogenase [Sedimentisphaerales bacterium]
YLSIRASCIKVTVARLVRDHVDKIGPYHTSPSNNLIGRLRFHSLSVVAFMFKNISIIGDGGMGTVLAMLLAEKNTPVRLWGYDIAQLQEMASAHENKKFLPGHKLPGAICFEPDDKKSMADANLIVSAVPCQFIRSVWTRLKKYTPQNTPVCSVAKGIENKTLFTPTQIIADVLGNTRPLAALSGPTIADELARKLPATACAASTNDELAQKIQHTFITPWFRIYTNTDVVGVELAGAMKNIIAIAAGIIDGVKAGDNAKAALLCRGLAEISRLGLAMGAKPLTFAGLTGLGDLVTTCISPKGRNRSFGERVGKGQTPQLAENATESVIEGIATCRSVVEGLLPRYKVEMPITEAVYDVLFRNKSVQEAIANLMTRRLKAELPDY